MRRDHDDREGPQPYYWMDPELRKKREQESDMDLMMYMLNPKKYKDYGSEPLNEQNQFLPSMQGLHYNILTKHESPEFSPFNAAPLGIPGNPLDGTPGLEDVKRVRGEKGTRAPLALPGRLSFQEMADVGTPPRGVPVAQEPHQLMVPDVVSATDPAFSAHPMVRGYLQGLGKVPAADTGSNSPWTQWWSKGRGMTTSGLRRALQSRGMDQGNYKTQGALPGGSN